MRTYLRITGAVNNDLVAAEARYHKACHATYISKTNLQYEGRQETSYDVAFQKLTEYMSADLDGGKAFEMSTVIGRYKDYLKEQHMTLDSYTTQRLKLRLKKHFGDRIVFHQPYDRTKSELLYSSAISLQDVINSAFKCNAASTERVSCERPSVEMVDCDRVKLLYRAAKLIKSEITDCRGISIRPPSVVDLSQTKAKSLISRQPLLVTTLDNCQTGEGR